MPYKDLAILSALIPGGRKNQDGIRMSMDFSVNLGTFNSFSWLRHLARCFIEYSRLRAARLESEERVELTIS
jgi:hypothetical protein